jgi:hypothetical protein
LNIITTHDLKSNDAREYFLSAIDSDGGRLSACISGFVEDGKFTSLAPADAGYERLKQLSAGGLIRGSFQESKGAFKIEKMPNLAGELSRMLLKLARKSPSAFIYIREPYLTATDNDETVRSLVDVDGVLYKLLKVKECNEQALEKTILEFRVSWSFLLIVSSSKDLSSTVILNEASAIAVNAYDGESYLIWTRS